MNDGWFGRIIVIIFSGYRVVIESGVGVVTVI